MDNPPLLAQASPDSTAHAVPPGAAQALCGAAAEGVTDRPFPGGARHVCRDCTRAAAIAASSVPLSRFGQKRAGGM
jgi:hypothetical protein